MVFLEKKKIKGHTYWYASERGLVDGKIKRTFQEYLGTTEMIIECMRKSKELPHIKLKSFQYGKTAALLSISDELNFIEIVNKHTNKKKIEGLTVGEYLLLNIIGRCDGALSENAMQKWFDKSTLSILWNFSHQITCQNFLNHYKYLDHETSQKIEDDLSRVLIKKGLTPHILFFDETSWFTYIEKSEDLPEKCSNNKQYNHHKDQLAMGLAVSGGSIPFMHEAYEGNKHDAKAFPRLLDALTKRLTNLKIDTENLIMVIDKGNNSQENIEDLVSRMHIVASAKHNQAEELLKIPLSEYKYLCTNSNDNKIYGYRTKHEIFGQEYTTVVLYSKVSCKKQKGSYEKSKEKILVKLDDLKRRLDSNKDKARDKSSVVTEINSIIYEKFKDVIGYEVGKIPPEKKTPILKTWIKKDVEKKRYAGFGKTIVFTDMHVWQSKKIAETYNQKYLVEDAFKLLNDYLLVPMGPVNYHKDFNIRSHIFLCIIGMLFYRYLAWKCKHFHLSLKRLVKELEGIRLALVKEKTNTKVKLVVEEMDSKQARLFSLLDMGVYMENR